ncbi:putative MFS family arabinose efflux permease [Hamadaea flava]|uniref:MFS transporter n=1 Tax=Hamadaea flava TaxID=1742688 RepID=A0ABV8LVQ6_9ACTN|nr:MFS transporter [Hamadaea flava]MCP2327649.1 putative MFS family arabinose efflux permease [Hamadaea flava]
MTTLAEAPTSVYRRVLARRSLRRVLPGLAVSALGDGMSMVAVAWLALQLAPPAQAGVWTGLAVAAYSLPASVGAVVFSRLVRRMNGAALVAVDAAVRAVVLGTIAALALAGALSALGFVGLLAVSSLLHAWGNAGAYTLVAEVLPAEEQIAGNALISTFTQAALVAGPALAGFLTAATGPAWVILADAGSFLVLALTALPQAGRSTAVRSGGGGIAWGELLRRPQLLGLVAVTCVLYFLYGPVEVALPVFVARELDASPGVLGAYWAVFSVGAVVGGLSAGLLQRWSLWTVVVGVVIGWGLALLPIGLAAGIWPGLVGFAVGGVIYGPFNAICTALFQRTSPPELLSGVLAARTALTIPSVAAGTLLGGPVVSEIGGQRTLLLSGVLTVVLGVAVAVVVRRPPRGDG